MQCRVSLQQGVLQNLFSTSSVSAIFVSFWSSFGNNNTTASF
jgi:hypothetical protein